MKTWIWFLTLAAFCLLSLSSSQAKKVFECEVCITYLTKFIDSLTKAELTVPLKIDEKFKEFCSLAKGKDQRFCYYIGGLPDSATYILGEMSKPISWGLPPEKVCEKLSKMDSQICELKYEKTIDLNTVDLTKMKVKDLKKILNGWDEECKGCVEKSDFIKKIEELKPIYTRTEL